MTRLARARIALDEQPLTALGVARAPWPDEGDAVPVREAVGYDAARRKLSTSRLKDSKSPRRYVIVSNTRASSMRPYS